MFSDDFVFSQTNLQDAADCPRRFWLRHVTRLKQPAPVAVPLGGFEGHSERGDRFHRLVHQAITGLPAPAIAASVAADPIVARWWAAWTVSGLRDLPPLHQPEITLSAPAPGAPHLRLLAKYDLIARAPDGQRVVIVDWKTAERVPPAEALRDRWQTTVYRWLLATTLPALAPAAITMIYWFAEAPDRPVVLPYSADAYAADEARLSGQIAALVSAVSDGETAFPKTDDERRCRYCPYRALCDRGPAGDMGGADGDDFDTTADDLTISFDQIAEVVF